MGIPVKADLDADISRHFRAQLIAAGYDVDKELANARAEAQQRAAASNTPALATIYEAHWLCMHYINVWRRRIERRYRPVFRAPGLCTNRLAAHHAKALYDISAVSLSAGDLGPRLSKSINRLRFDDRLINDWGIHHLHLGATSPQPGQPVARSGPLLFVLVRNDGLYFLDVLQHGRGHNPWSRQDLIDIIHMNWPDTIRRFRFTGISVGRRLTDDEIATGRKNGLTMFVQAKDGTAYMPPGGGYATSGMSLDAVTGADALLEKCRRLLKWATANSDALQGQILAQHGLRLNYLDLEVAFGAQGVSLREKQSNSLLHAWI